MKLLLSLSSFIFQAAAFSVCPTSQNNAVVDSRRDFLSNALIKIPSALVAGSVILNNPSEANAATSTAELVGDLETSLNKMDVIPDLLDQGEWDKVRTILKTPPVNKLWNLGEVSFEQYIGVLYNI